MKETLDGKPPPGRPVKKRKVYSPKAGARTLKVQIAVTPDGLIVQHRRPSTVCTGASWAAS